MRKIALVFAFLALFFRFELFAQADSVSGFQSRLLEIEALIDHGDIEEALGKAEKLGRESAKVGDYATLSHALNFQGKCLTVRQLFQEAMLLLDSSISVGMRHLPQPHSHTAQAHNNLGFCLQSTGHPKEAVREVKTALSMRKELFGEVHEMVSQSYFILSVVLGRQGDFQAEKIYLDKTVEVSLALHGPDHIDMQDPYNNLGVWYKKQGNLQMAQYYYERALDVLRKDLPADHYLLAPPYNNLGNLLLLRGANAEALVYLKRALDINMDRRPASAAINWHNVGGCYLKLGENAAARDAFQKSFDIEEDLFGSDWPFLANTLMNQARAYRLLKQNDAASDNLDRAAAILEKAPPRFAVEKGKLAMFRAELMYDAGNVERGRELYRKGLAIFEESLGRIHPKVVESYLQWGKLEMGQGNARESLQALETCEGRLLSEKGEHAAEGNRYTWPVQREIEFMRSQALPMVDSATGGFPAYEAVRKAISFTDSIRTHLSDDASQLHLADQGMGIYEHALEILEQLHRTEKDGGYLEEAFSIMEKSKSFLLSRNLLNAAGTKGGLLPDSLAAKERALKSSLARYDELLVEAEKGSPRMEKWDSVRFELRQEYGEFCERLAVAYPEYYALRFQPQVPKMENLQKELEEGDMLVEYFAGKRNWYVLGIGRSRVSLAKVPRTDELEEQILGLRAALSAPPALDQSAEENRLTFALPAHAIFQQLLKPVLNGAPPSGLMLVPDGPLSHIPFEVLLTEFSPTAQKGYFELAYLFKNTRIRYLNAGRFLPGRSVPQRAEGELLAMAPVFKGGESNELRGQPAQLPFSETEADRVGMAFGGMVSKGAAATESFFKAAASNYRMLHLATHALVNDSIPQRSGLLFSEGDDEEDGFLHGWELLGMELKADLAVLSACNTGVGKVQRGEGVMSLARDFRLAGCPAVVMSLWNANDKSTADLMAGFYGELKRGKEKDAALQSAKVNYLKQVDPLRAHPHFWAGFVLIGDHSPIDSGSPVWPWLLLGVAALILWWKYRRF